MISVARRPSSCTNTVQIQYNTVRVHVLYMYNISQFRYDEKDYNSPKAKRLQLATPRGSIGVELVPSAQTPRSAPVQRITRRVAVGNVFEIRTTSEHPVGPQRYVFLSHAEPTSEEWLRVLRAAIDAFAT